MTDVLVDASEATAPPEYLTTRRPCPVCMTNLPLDDDQPKTGTVRWRISSTVRVRTGRAVGFECPNGHSSDDDTELLKAFPPRRF